MGPTYAFSSWLFARAISAIYLVAFLSLMGQARGLWGAHGISPMRDFKKAVEEQVDSSRYWKAPAIFWLSTSDDMIYGVAVTGAVAAGFALIGFAQGWSLLLCFAMYLSLCSFGQEFMSFQWDALLLEVGFVALFFVPWRFDFTLMEAVEPHWIVRGMFYVVLFKLMFLSGVVKLMSGDPSWRDLTALDYHFWTQPLPNPLSPFVHAWPEWFHKGATALTLLIELVFPFFVFWSRTRVLAAVGLGFLSVGILLTGNYAFFNFLTLALLLWLIPDRVWEPLTERLPFHLHFVTAPMFPHPVTAAVMGVLALLSLFWCTRFWLPDAVVETVEPALTAVQSLHLSSSYGLFATMTKTRPEIVIEGSLDGQNWQEYEFKYKPGNIYRRPPVVAPFHPRLDWQMWFAALGGLRQNSWLGGLMLRLFENSPDVTALFETNPFATTPPKFLRARLYSYEFVSPAEIWDSGQWWKRSLSGEYSPVFRAP